MHPFIDTSKLTDDQLHDKLGKLQAYLGMQTGLGHESAIESIEAVILSLQLEQQNRFQKMVQEGTEAQTPALLEPITLGKIEEQDDLDENQQL